MADSVAQIAGRQTISFTCQRLTRPGVNPHTKAGRLPRTATLGDQGADQAGQHIAQPGAGHHWVATITHQQATSRIGDQGIRPTGSGTTIASNIVPADSSAIAFSRTPGQVLNIVYLNRTAQTAGGFFPNGVNGTIRQSAASGT